MAIHFHELTLVNFMPFYGEQKLQFGQAKPIVISYGESMWSKTSFLRDVGR